MRQNPKPIPEDIREYLEYNENTGDLIWIKKPSSKVCIGDKAGTKHSKGYIHIAFKGKKHLIHRVAWFLYTSEQPPDNVDHKNGNKTDNSWLNLRVATERNNMHNKGKPTTNTSGYKGVSWNKKASKWLAKIKFNNQTMYLGLFNTPEEAHLSYCIAADKYHKEFANYG